MTTTLRGRWPMTSAGRIAVASAVFAGLFGLCRAALAAPPVIDSFTATPPSLAPGQSSTLAWTTTGAIAAVLSEDSTPGPGGGGTQISVPVNGSLVVTPAQTTTYTLAVSGADGTASRDLVVTVSCPVPGTPSFTSVPAGAVTAGAPVTVAWWSQGADPSARYEVEVGGDVGCVAPVRLATSRSATSIPTTPGCSGTVTVTVRAVSGFGCSSPATREARVEVRPAPPTFTLLEPQSPPALAFTGQAPTATSTVTVKNVGADAGLVSMLTGDDFFTFAPTGPMGLTPGASMPASFSFARARTADAGLQRGNVVFSWTDATGAFHSASTPIFLSVLGPDGGAGPGARLAAVGTDEVHFRTSGSASPAPVDVTIVNLGAAGARLRPAIGPSGVWLGVSGDFATPLGPGATRTFRLTADRGRRASDEAFAPVVTSLRFETVDGPPTEGTSIRVLDEELTPHGFGVNRPDLPAGQGSLVLGSAVNAVGFGGTLFVSDGWIRNRGPEPATVEMTFTPNGADGYMDAMVKKATVTVPPYWTTRLADFLPSLYGVTSVSGQVEIRSPALPQLSIRATVDSVTQKGGAVARYGAEIPIVQSGQGARRGSSGSPSRVVLAGIRSAEAGFRTNVILAETSGRPVTVELAAHDAAGALVGRTSVALKAWSKEQVDATNAALFPVGSRFDGGTIEVVPTQGDGVVTAFATVIDNASQSYATRVGAVLEAAGAGGGTGAPGRPAFLPAVARSAAGNASFYTTTLAVANVSTAPASLSLTYLPEFGGGPVGPVAVRIEARSAGPRAVLFEDLLGTLFGVTEGTAGMLRVEGDLGSVVVAAEVSTPVDVNDPSKGRSISAVNPAPGAALVRPGLFDADSLEVVGAPESGAPSRVSWLPAIEEGAAVRTNLILAELSGKSATVRVSLTTRGLGGARLAEGLYSLGPFERWQVNKVIRELVGLSHTRLEMRDVEISVEGVSGEGRVLAMATKIDNDPLSKRADVFTLGPAIPSCGACGSP